jgi:hypothetical protein
MGNVTTKAPTTGYPPESQSGFGPGEFPISALIFLMPAFSVFGWLSEIQSKSNYQNELHAAIGLSGKTVFSPAEERITSDLTGPSSPGSPDKGDLDGNANDPGENATISQGGLAQFVAGHMPGLPFRFCNSAGVPMVPVQDVGKINITVEGLRLLADPKNHRISGLRPGSDFLVATRCEGLRMLV